jgi:hypothetical protein
VVESEPAPAGAGGREADDDDGRTPVPTMKIQINNPLFESARPKNK